MHWRRRQLLCLKRRLSYTCVRLCTSESLSRASPVLDKLWTLADASQTRLTLINAVICDLFGGILQLLLLLFFVRVCVALLLLFYFHI